MVKNPPAMQETWVQSLGWEDPPQNGMVTHSSIFAWRIPMDRGAWRATVCGVAKSWTGLSEQAQHMHLYKHHLKNKYCSVALVVWEIICEIKLDNCLNG